MMVEINLHWDARWNILACEKSKINRIKYKGSQNPITISMIEANISSLKYSIILDINALWKINSTKNSISDWEIATLYQP